MPTGPTMPLVLALLLASSSSVRAQVGGLTEPPSRGAATTLAPKGTSALHGHVLAADTGQPLRQALVRLLAVDVPGGDRAVVTDADGSYEFNDLHAGRCTLTASKAGYITLPYGQTAPSKSGTPLDLRDSQIVERIDFSLSRGSVVRGRVLDEYGEPMPNVQVAAMSSQAGRSGPPMIQRIASTNDLGEFRIFDLSPGSYLVQATWRRASAVAGSVEDAAGYAPTFFPSTTAAAEAQRVSVGIGTITNDVVIVMTPVTTATISGTAVDSHGQPLIGMIRIINGAGGLNAVFGAQIRSDGSFLVANLTPGEYTLETQPRSESDERAVLTIVVAGVDVAGIHMIGSKPVSVTGRVVVDAGQSPPTGHLIVTTEPVRADALIGFTSVSPPAMVLDDNTFAAKAASGRIRVGVAGLPSGWSVRAVLLHGVDVTDSGIEIRPKEDIDGIDIELTNRLTSIVGVVTDGHGDATEGYTALIFPQDQNLWSNVWRYIRIARPNQDGRFTVDGLPPGDYCAVAIDQLDPGMIGNPEFLKSVKDRATMFSLSEAETKSLALKVSTSGP